MRPEILNPLFAETRTLEGVGPKLKKPLDKLGLTRVRDIAYHLPERFVTRRAIDNIDDGGEGEQISREPIGPGAVVGDDHDLARSGNRIAPHSAKELSLGFGDELIAGPHHLVNRWDRFRSIQIGRAHV